MFETVSPVLGIFEGLGNYQLAKTQAAISTRLSKVNADAENKVRGARNERAKAQGDLARWAQSVNNQKVLDEGASAAEATIVNYFRGSDQDLTGSFEQSIRMAEEAGMQAAAAGASGLRGGVVDTINQATALRNSRAVQQALDFGNMQRFDVSRRMASIWNQTIGGLDNSVLLDNMDYNVSYAQEAAKPSLFPYIAKPVFDALKAGASAMSGNPAPMASGNGVKASRATGPADFSNWKEDGSVDYSFQTPKKKTFSFGSQYQPISLGG